MAVKNITQALDNVDMLYQQIVEIANDILRPILEPINIEINDIKNNYTNLPIDLLRDKMLLIQLKSFELSEVKEKSTLKAECAEALRKEKYAISFNEATGTAGTKDNLALLKSSEEIVVECLYNLISDLLKTKLDELHRLVDVFKSVLVSKMQEAKFMNVSTTAEIPVYNKEYNNDPYANVRQSLNMGKVE